MMGTGRGVWELLKEAFALSVFVKIYITKVYPYMACS